MVGLRVAVLCRQSNMLAFPEAFVKEPVHFFVILAFIGSEYEPEKRRKQSDQT